MAEALYRKYRPSNLSDIYGQDVVVKTLIKSFVNDKIAHAYLFSGPRGIGKTSLAKIIAKTINCDNYPIEKACGKCEKCKLNVNSVSDIIEIDAASNNGVDEIRELKNNVRFMPSTLKYKVYIIDEVHMLSIGAFNALLKTLEEPPQHVIFILATTELHKIPETIISRCQCFNLNKISDLAIVNRLEDIILKEKISCDREIIENIARLSNGGMRDAINMLEQLVSFSDEKILLDDVFLLNGIVDPKNIAKLILSTFNGDIKEIVGTISLLKNGGKDIYKLSEELIFFVKEILILKLTKGESVYFDNSFIKNISLKKLYNFLDLLNDSIFKIKFSMHPHVLLEVLLLKIATGIVDNNHLEKVENKKTESLKVVAKVEKIIKKKEVSNEKESKKAIKIVKNDITLKESFENEIKDFEEFEEFKINRVNNIFSKASKENLKKIALKFKNIEEYLSDRNLSVVATLLLDSKIRVASDWGFLISYDYSSMANKLNGLLMVAEKLLEKIIGKRTHLIAITSEEWEIYKKEYINTKNKEEKYFFIEEDFDIKELFIVNKKIDTPLIEETLKKVDKELVEIK